MATGGNPAVNLHNEQVANPRVARLGAQFCRRIQFGTGIGDKRIPKTEDQRAYPWLYVNF